MIGVDPNSSPSGDAKEMEAPLLADVQIIARSVPSAMFGSCDDQNRPDRQR